MKIRAIAALVLALSSGCARASTAAAALPSTAPKRVVFRSPGCPASSFDESSFVRGLRAELAVNGIHEVKVVTATSPVSTHAGVAVLTLEGSCDKSAAVILNVDRAISNKYLRDAVGAPWSERTIVQKAVGMILSHPAGNEVLDKRNPGLGTSNQRVGAYVVGAVGFAGVVVGAVAGLLGLEKLPVVHANCDPRNDKCNAAGLIAIGAARTLGNASTAGWLTALVAVPIGVGMFAAEPARSKPQLKARVVRVSRIGVTFGIEVTW